MQFAREDVDKAEATMAHKTREQAIPRGAAAAARDAGQIVLVLQGGGALGAYQVGVYEALHEAGLEPDWVIGTSIGAINGAIIAGNPPEQRLEKLKRFWESVQGRSRSHLTQWWPAAAASLANMEIYTHGIAGFFGHNPLAAWGAHLPLGIEQAAFYTTAPLLETLMELADFDYINRRNGRLTLGAVNVQTGDMHYFDNREQTLTAKHVMASGALPPAFPAVRVDGELYWDGGIYSNTPIEVVLDDKPRRNSLIFSANVWHARGPEPQSILQVLARQKDIQYASRGKSHIARQQQIHRMRHMIRELGKHIPPEKQDALTCELLDYGCATVMHVVRLAAPRIDREDHTKDIDFSPAGVHARWKAGYEHTRRMIECAPWRREVDAMDGIIIHEEDV
jgi:NTE family protein